MILAGADPGADGAVTISLLGEPVPFARMRLSRGMGGHFIPARQRNAAAAMQLAAEYAMREQGAQMFDEPLHVELVAECGIPASWSKKRKAAALVGLVRPGRPDLDNVYKLLADAFNSIVWRDDSLVVELVASKRYGLQPKIVATVRPALARADEFAKVKRRAVEARRFGGECDEAPSQALARYRDSARQNQGDPLSEDGQPVLRRVGLPRGCR